MCTGVYVVPGSGIEIEWKSSQSVKFNRQLAGGVEFAGFEVNSDIAESDSIKDVLRSAARPWGEAG